MGSAFVVPALLTLGLSSSVFVAYHIRLTCTFSLSSRHRQIVSEDERPAACVDAKGARATQCHLRRRSRHESHQAPWSQ
jgi:hypothetical protein